MRLLGLGWTDLLVTAAAGLTFMAVAISHGHPAPEGPPSEQAIQAMADELGVTADQLRHAAEMGGNAVVGARYDATEVMQGVTEVLAYGTAVFVEASR